MFVGKFRKVRRREKFVHKWCFTAHGTMLLLPHVHWSPAVVTRPRYQPPFMTSFLHLLGRICSVRNNDCDGSWSETGCWCEWENASGLSPRITRNRSSTLPGRDIWCSDQRSARRPWAWGSNNVQEARHHEVSISVFMFSGTSLPFCSPSAWEPFHANGLSRLTLSC